MCNFKDYSWQFTFLAANIDAFAAGGSMGISAASTAGYAVEKTGAAFSASTNSVLRGRAAVQRGEVADLSYTEEELKSMGGE